MSTPRNVITALSDAEPEHKLEVYRNLGLRLIYSPATQTVRAELNLAAHRWDSVCVRGATQIDTQPIRRWDSVRVRRGIQALGIRVGAHYKRACLNNSRSTSVKPQQGPREIGIGKSSPFVGRLIEQSTFAEMPAASISRKPAKTWFIEDDVPEIVQDDAADTRLAGVRRISWSTPKHRTRPRPQRTPSAPLRPPSDHRTPS
jgi:hypothetical protein